MLSDIQAADAAKMPASVQIGAVPYAIIADSAAWLQIEHETQTKGYYGHTKNSTAQIFLNPDGSAGVTRLTLWHEIIHALCETVMGSPDWHHLGKDKDDREEAVIRKIEHPTLQVLRDNPDLVAYLVS